MIKHDLNDDDENKMIFDIFLSQMLKLCRFQITMKKIQKIEFKILKITILINEIQSTLNHFKNKDVVNLMKKMKARTNALDVQKNSNLKEITDAMKKITINVNNLINYVILSVQNANLKKKIKITFSASTLTIFLTDVNFIFSNNFANSSTTQESMMTKKLFEKKNVFLLRKSATFFQINL